MSIMDALVVRMDSGRYRLGPVRYADLQATEQVRSAYPDMDLDLADAINVCWPTVTRPTCCSQSTTVSSEWSHPSARVSRTFSCCRRTAPRTDDPF